jgi:hypothetical protein
MLSKIIKRNGASNRRETAISHMRRPPTAKVVATISPGPRRRTQRSDVGPAIERTSWVTTVMAGLGTSPHTIAGDTAEDTQRPATLPARCNTLQALHEGGREQDFDDADWEQSWRSYFDRSDGGTPDPRTCGP